MERPGYVANGPDRCFHCKTELYEIARGKQHEWGLAEIANGTNVDDLGDHRPGLEFSRRSGCSIGLWSADALWGARITRKHPNYWLGCP